MEAERICKFSKKQFSVPNCFQNFKKMTLFMSNKKLSRFERFFIFDTYMTDGWSSLVYWALHATIDISFIIMGRHMCVGGLNRIPSVS